MAREEAINRLNRIAGKAVHTPGEMPFVMSIDDGIAVRMAIEVLQQSDHIADGGKKDDHLREVTKMVDTISRQAAIDALGERPLAWTESEYETGLQNQWEADVDAIKAVPSAQPEIIRCKDCEYYHPYYCEVWSKFGIIQTRENGYCYMAERREE